MRVELTKVNGKGGNIYEGKNKMPDSQVIELASEARAIESFPLYKKIMDSMRWTANEAMYQKSKTIDDIIFSKAILYTLEVIEAKISNIAKTRK